MSFGFVSGFSMIKTRATSKPKAATDAPIVAKTHLLGECAVGVGLIAAPHDTQKVLVSGFCFPHFGQYMIVLSLTSLCSTLRAKIHFGFHFRTTICAKALLGCCASDSELLQDSPDRSVTDEFHNLLS